MWGWPWQILGAIRVAATVREGSFFQKKTLKLLTKFPGLVTSGHHNSAMITNANNSRPNGPPTRYLISFFIVRITSESFFWAHQKGTYPNVCQRLLSDIVQ